MNTNSRIQIMMLSGLIAGVGATFSCGAARLSPDAGTDARQDRPQEISDASHSDARTQNKPDGNADRPKDTSERDATVADSHVGVVDAHGMDMAPPPVCSTGQTRACYTGPQGTSGVGACKPGTQVCANNAWGTTCSGQVTPTAEVCNGIDDDCNGVVDDIPRTDFEQLAYTQATTEDPLCTATDDTQWLHCNMAIQNYCKSQSCRTSGFGYVELGATAGDVSCLSKEPTSEVLTADLAKFGSCPSPSVTYAQISDRFACQQAIDGYCRSVGYVSGFGPVGSAASTSFTVVCVHSGHATAVNTTYDALAQNFSGCSGPTSPTTAPGGCLSAAKRFCGANGHLSGFGPVSNGAGQATTVICLDP